MTAPLAAAGAAAGATPPVDARFVDLFDGVDDLIKRVADTENPEIRKIRARVHASMMVARNACQNRAVMDAHPADEEDRGDALGVALLVGVGLGVIMSMQP